MNNEKKQTAVQLLIEKLEHKRQASVSSQTGAYDVCIAEAKQLLELEKQQIKDSYYSGWANDTHPDELIIDEAEQYYNQTYEK